MKNHYRKLLLKLSIPFLVASGGNIVGQTALDLAGSGNRVETVADLDVTNGFTIEYNVYLDNLKDYNGLITKGCSNVGAPLDVYINSGGGMTVFYGNCSITGGGNPAYTFSAATWYHIAHTYDPVAGQGQLYVNGSLITTWNVGAGVGNGTVPITIGNRADNVTDADAEFDNVRVWSGVRSAADILANKDVCLTGTETGLEILYNMEEGTGTVLHDLATNNGTQDGNIIGTVAWGAGVNCMAPMAAALNFNGSNNKIVPTSTTNVPVGNSLYTIEAWIKPSSGTSSSALGIAGWGSYGSGNQVNAFRTTAQGGLDNYWWGNDLVISPTGFNLFDGNWHHVAATFDGTTRTIYVDGIARGSDTPTGHNIPNTSNMAVGVTNGGEFFNGSMDEIRIWNIARTPCQIQADMKCELSGLQTGLALYYKFNEGGAGVNNATVTTAADSSGNNNNGTLTNFTLTDTISNWIASGAVVSGVSCGSIVYPIINANSPIICAGTTTTLTAGGASTYTWSTNDTGATIIQSPMVTTIYTVTGANANNCASTSTLTVKVNPSPQNQAVVPSMSVICYQDSSVINVGSSEVGVNYSLQNNTNNSIIAGPVAGTGNAINFATGVLSTTTTYNVFAQYAGAGTALHFDGATGYVNIANGFPSYNKYTFSVWVNPADLSNGKFFSTTDYELAVVGGQIQFWTSSAGGITSGSLATGVWTNVAVSSDGSTIRLYLNGIPVDSASTSGSLPAISAMKIGKHIAAACCYFSGKMDELRMWNTNLSQAQITAGMSNCLAGNESGLQAYYNFENGTGSLLSDITGNGNNGVLTNMDTINDWVSGTSNCGNPGCSNIMAQTVTVTVNPLPNLLVNNPSVCVGDSATLTASGATTYTWSTSDTIASIKLFPSVTTTYTVTGTDANGCKNKDTSVVSVTSLPIVSVNSAVVCAGGTATLTASGASTYTWSTTETTVSINATPTVSINYTVTGSDANNCLNQAISVVTVNNLPMVSVAASSSIVCAGSTTTLTASGANSYTWSTTEVAASISPSPTVTTNYTVTGTDVNNCANADTISITVNNCTTGMNKFTDNSNQVSVYPNPNNGTFIIKGINEQSDLHIINELGQVIQTISLKQINNYEVTLSGLDKGVYYLIGDSNLGQTKQLFIVIK